MAEDVYQFYQRLAQDYHLIYADWSRSIQRQAAALDRLIRQTAGDPPLDVLDCSCGIGTQAIGLAGRGYRVHATDISPAAVERAAHEAELEGVTLTTGVADMRHLDDQVEGTFDLVISCDNAVPHLLSDDDLHLASRSMHAKLHRGGLVLISIRDYDHLLLELPHATLPQVIDGEDGRRIVFQVWDWAADHRRYTLSMFILRESGGTWHTSRYGTTYRALLRAELGAVLEQAGFVEVRWHMPEDSGYYQPVVTARRA